jgi:hypothetical protein
MKEVLRLAAKIVSDSECFHQMMLVEEAARLTELNLKAGHCLEAEALAFFKRQLFNLQYLSK